MAIPILRIKLVPKPLPTDADRSSPPPLALKPRLKFDKLRPRTPEDYEISKMCLALPIWTRQFIESPILPSSVPQPQALRLH
ncbi:hypothetical protein MCOR02_004314 [Pyricularia oryzae]|nr:hypothetical protein MCOR02_004314 [Pyricularia oryzae]KAI6288921.1 hypothetical protein MCOR34_010804 [Pyricularia oryzae]KAI6477782.1 hypothetical protein MCOR13_011753 [Pyricularia oryzae]KAI6550705.1 hypothetical protein MCOR04_011203 [Pyricularia oryzae]KAI6629518.1 hypothetical protein MCOR14_008284 [Pyricularia oryzae]